MRFRYPWPEQATQPGVVFVMRPVSVSAAVSACKQYARRNRLAVEYRTLGPVLLVRWNTLS